MATTKRRKISYPLIQENEALPSHPLAIQPYGNSLLHMYQSHSTKYLSHNGISRAGYFILLPHQITLFILNLLDPKDLAAFSRASSWAYQLASTDELWRTAFLSAMPQKTLHHDTQGLNQAQSHSDTRHWRFKASWKASYIATYWHSADSHGPGTDDNIDSSTSTSLSLNLPPLYSDFLYHPWRCKHFPLTAFRNSCQQMLAMGSFSSKVIPIFHSPNVQQQVEKLYQSHTKFHYPWIWKAGVAHWPALKKWAWVPHRSHIQRHTKHNNNTEKAGTDVDFEPDCNSTPEIQAQNELYFDRAMGNALWDCAGVKMTWSQYKIYASTLRDDQPLYLFDFNWKNKAPDLMDDFVPPDCYGNDLLQLLGKDRPDHSWMIIGPERSGSSFHIDPNATSAWNATIQGEKLWVMFPPGISPPGIYPSQDGSTVTAPISAFEWFLNFYADARKSPHFIQAITQPGDLMHVPRGWWHCVLNLSHSIAITENFVSDARGYQDVQVVLHFMQSRPEQISGLRTIEQKQRLAANFMNALQRHKPELFQKLRPLSSHATNDNSGSAGQKPEKEQEKNASNKYLRSLWQSLSNARDSNINDGDEKKMQSMNNKFCFGFSQNGK